MTNTIITHETNRYNKNALHLAAENNHYEIVKFIIESNIYNHSPLDQRRKKPIDYAIEKKFVKIAAYLAQQGATHDDVEKLIHIAIEENDIEAIQYLIAQDESLVNQLNEIEQTVLHTAASKGNVKIINYLVEKGAVVDALDCTNNPPLHIAIENHNLDAVACLVAHQANLNQADIDGNSALHVAVQTGNLEMVRYIIEQNVAINQPDVNDFTPIMIAFENRNREIVELLAHHGAVLPANYDINELDPTQNIINHAQSTHDISVHKGVSDSIKRLYDYYFKGLNAKQIEEKVTYAIEALEQFVENLPTTQSDSITDPYNAAKRYFPQLRMRNFKDLRSNVTMQEALALVWIGLNDPVQRQKLRDEQKLTEEESQLSLADLDNKRSKEEHSNLISTVSNFLYHACRAYNISANGFDNGEQDCSTCTSGAFNGLVSTLNGRHELVFIPLVNSSSITQKAYALINSLFDDLTIDEKQLIAAENMETMSDLPVLLYNHLKQQLETALREEFTCYETPGLNLNSIIIDIMDAFDYFKVPETADILQQSLSHTQPILNHFSEYKEEAEETPSHSLSDQTINEKSEYGNKKKTP